MKLLAGADIPLRDPVLEPGRGMLSLPWEGFFQRLGLHLDRAEGFVVSTKTVTTTYTVDVGDTMIEANANGGAFTVFLPPVASHEGKVIFVKKTDSSGNAVTIDANASETIDGATTKALTSQWEALQLVSNGARWSIV